MSLQPDISQIKGAKYLGRNNSFFLLTPRVDLLSYDSVSFKATYSVENLTGQDLFYIDNNYNEIPVTVLNNGSFSQELSTARDLTNEFWVLFAYNYVLDSIIIREGSPAATPIKPALQANEILIDYKKEPVRGSDPEPGQNPISDNNFNFKDIFSDGSNGLELDFSYGSNRLTLTENITSITYNLANKRFSVLELEVPGDASFSITWPANFYESNGSELYSTTSTDLNQFVITLQDPTPGSEKFIFSNNVIDLS